MSELRVLPVAGLPEVTEGMRIGELVAARAELADGDVVAISQKIVSKAEGRVRRLAAEIPGAEARKLAAVLGKEPALVELILEESAAVLRAERGVLIVETHHGFVCANAGIDSSNLPEEGTVALLPEDPDASARRIRAEISAAAGASVAVVVSDSFGRAWRLGQASPELRALELRQLHSHQVAWAAEQAASFQEYLRAQGSVERIEGAWPIVPEPALAPQLGLAA